VLNASDRRNSYGCTPFPRPALLDFGSSTASSISPRAFVRAREAQAQMWLGATRTDPLQVFDDWVEDTRATLRSHLGVADAEVVFSPSGTDAQLQALFLVKALLGAPLATIIVGADQTGSGTAHTARGHHFSDCTALGTGVEKGAPIPGLAENVRTVGIAFCDEAGRLRSDDEMDAAVQACVADAVGRDEKVLLQVMDSSKLGWRGPSLACIERIAADWPDHVRIVVDACQMRIGRPQLRDYLARGYFVLMTGSKFFTGPAFSGALLVPASQADAIDGIVAGPRGLGSYTSRHDWPRRWHRLRAMLPAEPNYGQWLRWEACLEEMKAYFEAPTEFRDRVLKEFAVQVPLLIGASQNLQLMAEQCGVTGTRLNDEMRHRTIFSFVPHRQGETLPREHCASLYRALGRNLSGLLPPDTPDSAGANAARICQIGQPVALGHRAGAALRLCASARLVSGCWARAASAPQALAPVLADMRAVIEKLDWLIAHPEFCESETT
jgi:selenocysteine lyase/cysteine desulfurase